MTFAATGNAALYLGARPVFADVDAVDRPDRPACSSRTRSRPALERSSRSTTPASRPTTTRFDAIAAATRHAGHRRCRAFARRARTGARPSAPSPTPPPFPSTRSSSSRPGEGGAVVTDDAAFTTRVAEFRSHGMVRDRSPVRRDDGPWYMEMQQLGLQLPHDGHPMRAGAKPAHESFRGSSRVVARSQTRYDEASRGRRAGPARRAARALSRPGTSTSFALLTRPTATFFEALRDRGIGVQVHYLPVYRHPYYEELGYRAGLCPKAEDFYAARGLAPDLSRADGRRCRLASSRRLRHVARDVSRVADVDGHFAATPGALPG